MRTNNTQTKLPRWNSRKRIGLEVMPMAAFSENGKWIAESHFGSGQITLKAITVDAIAGTVRTSSEIQLRANEVQAFCFRPDPLIAQENSTVEALKESGVKLDCNELFICDRRASFIRRFLPSLGQLRPIEVNSPTALCFDPTGRFLACGSEDGTISVFDLNLEGNLLYERALRFRPQAQNCAATRLLITVANPNQLVGLNAQGKGFCTYLNRETCGATPQRSFHRFSAKQGQLFTLADLGSPYDIAAVGQCPLWIHNLLTGDTSIAAQELGEYIYFAKRLASDELLLAGKRGLELHRLQFNNGKAEVERIWHYGMPPDFRLVALYEDAASIIIARTTTAS